MISFYKDTQKIKKKTLLIFTLVVNIFFLKNNVI